MKMEQISGVVYNACYGRFHLSDAAIEMFLVLKGFPYEKTTHSWGSTYRLCTGASFETDEIDRSDPVLIRVVNTLKDRANTPVSRLRVAEYPPGTLYRIEDYDGKETVIVAAEQTWKTVL